MKKLMFGLAAVAGMVACAEIESANVVGYSQSALQAGSTMTGAQFVNVGATSMPLQQIKPQGDDTSDNVIIQPLDANGLGVGSYAWVDYAGDDGDQEAWIDPDTYEIAEGVEFPIGQGLWVSGTSADQAIRSAGEVCLDDALIDLRNGNTAVVNPFPIPVNLQDILVVGEGASDNVIIQTLDANGLGVSSYAWVDYAGDNGDQEAWIDPDTYEIIEGVEFTAGAGLWVQGMDGLQLRFPAPEL